jgi:hypothetical protein
MATSGETGATLYRNQQPPDLVLDAGDAEHAGRLRGLPAS